MEKKKVPPLHNTANIWFLNNFNKIICYVFFYKNKAYFQKCESWTSLSYPITGNHFIAMT